MNTLKILATIQQYKDYCRARKNLGWKNLPPQERKELKDIWNVIVKTKHEKIFSFIKETFPEVSKRRTQSTKKAIELKTSQFGHKGIFTSIQKAYEGYLTVYDELTRNDESFCKTRKKSKGEFKKLVEEENGFYDDFTDEYGDVVESMYVTRYNFNQVYA